MPATVHNDLVYVHTTMGTVTCLKLASGKVRWSFLAAPNRDVVMVNGQLESRWPVPNTIIHDGMLHVSAGRHSELDGGLWFWALDPQSGDIKIIYLHANDR